jgi:hypothetical protein
MKPLFFSTFLYAPCKLVGAADWPDTLAYWLERLDEAPWHGLRTLGQARRVAECRVHVDASTYIDRARCVAAGQFLYRSGAECDVWLTCDDDVTADHVVLAQLVDVARATRGVCALPYLNRDGGSMTFRKVRGPTHWVEGCPIRAVDRVGMGLVAMHREAVSVLAEAAVPFFDGPQRDRCPFIFCNGVDDGTFIGEDFGFCALAERADLPVHVLLDAPGQHMNLTAKLDLDGRICVQGADVAARLSERLDAFHAASAETLPPQPD